MPDARWHHAQTLAAGQVAEFKVWAELIRQSLGDLHVFLPLRDRGLDAVLHRLSDGAYLPVQVKARTELTPAGQVHITVTASSLVEDDAMIVAVLVDGAELGSFALVVTEADFRRLAAHDVVDGREYLTAAFEMHAGGDSRWVPYLVPREELARRFDAVTPAETVAPPAAVDRAAEGFLGEAEVIRLLAEADNLALFRPFPDLETVEVLARDLASGRCVGLQVKTSGFDSTHLENRVYFRRSSFRPADTTLVVVLGWDRDSRRFADECLLIPSVEIASVTRDEGEWMVMELEPRSVSHRRLERFVRPLAGLAGEISALTAR